MIRIIPTDTCYGLAGELTKADFLRIYELKGRDFSKPLALVVKDFENISDIAFISKKQISFLKEYPYPFSVVLPLWNEGNFSEFFKKRNYSLISVRIWKKIFPKDIIEKLSFPMFLTSANKSGQPESHTFAEAKKSFPDIDGFDGWICQNPASNVFSFQEDGSLYFFRKNY